MALYGMARRMRHSNQTTVEVTSTHSQAGLIAAALTKVSGFLQGIKATAEQLTQAARWGVWFSAPLVRLFFAARFLEARADWLKLLANCRS